MALVRYSEAVNEVARRAEAAGCLGAGTVSIDNRSGSGPTADLESPVRRLPLTSLSRIEASPPNAQAVDHADVEPRRTAAQQSQQITPS